MLHDNNDLLGTPPLPPILKSSRTTVQSRTSAWSCHDAASQASGRPQGHPPTPRMPPLDPSAQQLSTSSASCAIAGPGAAALPLAERGATRPCSMHTNSQGPRDKLAKTIAPTILHPVQELYETSYITYRSRPIWQATWVPEGRGSSPCRKFPLSISCELHSSIMTLRRKAKATQRHKGTDALIRLQ